MINHANSCSIWALCNRAGCFCIIPSLGESFSPEVSSFASLSVEGFTQPGTAIPLISVDISWYGRERRLEQSCRLRNHCKSVAVTQVDCKTWEVNKNILHHAAHASTGRRSTGQSLCFFYPLAITRGFAYFSRRWWTITWVRRGMGLLSL